MLRGEGARAWREGGGEGWGRRAHLEGHTALRILAAQDDHLLFSPHDVLQPDLAQNQKSKLMRLLLLLLFVCIFTATARPCQ